MYIHKLFDYQPLQRIDSEDGRKYVVDGQLLPSVTTILSRTKDMTFINQWKQNIGEHRAQQIVKESSDLGTQLHKNIENYILGHEMAGIVMAKIQANIIIKNGLSKVSEVWGTEVALYSKDLYAGTTDFVGLHDSKPSIVDFKNSRSEKKLEWIDDYAAQLAAYAIAHNEMYGTNIKRGVVMVVTRDAKYQEFVFEGAEFDRAVSLWLTSLSGYYK